MTYVVLWFHTDLVLLHELLHGLQSVAVFLTHGHREALLDPQLQHTHHITLGEAF